MTPAIATSTPSLPDRVARGAALLDEREPGWAERINLRQLDMTSCIRCVLGQLYSNYGIGLAMLRKRVGSDFGFYYRSDEGSESYETLEALWRTAIKARRKAKS